MMTFCKYFEKFRAATDLSISRARQLSIVSGEPHAGLINFSPDPFENDYWSVLSPSAGDDAMTKGAKTTLLTDCFKCKLQVLGSYVAS